MQIRQNRTLSVNFSITKKKKNLFWWNILESRFKNMLTSSQSVLSIASHSVGFVQNDQFATFSFPGRCRVEQRFRTGEVQNLLTNNIDAAIIRSVQLKKYLKKIVVYSTRNRPTTNICKIHYMQLILWYILYLNIYICYIIYIISYICVT